MDKTIFVGALGKNYNAEFKSYVVRFAAALEIDKDLLDQADYTKVSNFWFTFDILGLIYQQDRTIIDTFNKMFSMLEEKEDVKMSISGLNNFIKEEHPVLYELSLIKHSLDNRRYEKLNNVIYWEGFLFWYLRTPHKEKHYACYDTKTNSIVWNTDKSFKDFIYYFIKSDLFKNPLTYFNVEEGEKEIKELNGKITHLIRNHTFMIDKLGYKPSKEILYFQDKQKLLNSFTAPELYFHYEQKEEYSFPHIEEHLLYLCGNDKGAYNWFIKWFAWKLQYPERKIPTAILFRTIQGAGKGIVEEYIIMPIFGVENFRSIDNDALTKEWGGYLKNRQFIIANEVQFNFKRDYQNLKRIVSDSYLDIQIKGHENETIKNYTQMMFFSNMDNSIKIEEGDRRFTVVDQQVKKEKSYYKELVEFIPSEIEDFVSYLKSLDINYQDVSTSYDTEAKTTIQELHRHPIYGFIDDLRDVAGNLLNAYIVYNPALPTRPSIERETVSVEEFYQYWLGYCKVNNVQAYHYLAKNKFSSKLKELEIHSKAIYIEKKTIRVFNIQDIFTDQVSALKIKTNPTYDNSIVGYMNALTRVFSISCADNTEHLEKDMLFNEMNKLGCNDNDLIKLTIDEAITRGEIFESTKGEYRTNV